MYITEASKVRAKIPASVISLDPKSAMNATWLCRLGTCALIITNKMSGNNSSVELYGLVILLVKKELENAR